MCIRDRSREKINSEIANYNSKSDGGLIAQRSEQFSSTDNKETQRVTANYEGELLNNVPNGKGIRKYADGTVYQGEWKLGMRDGYGILSDSQGNKIYEGDWSRDLQNGEGVMYNNKCDKPEFRHFVNYKDFSDIGNYWLRYEGEFVNGERTGIGTLNFPNGDKFMGSFLKGRINGQGTFTTRNGHISAGEWSNNILVFEF
eukprot:TRINITY_DN704_c0_g1_i18.p1 TRINITY_DN704_c0_g1~~TRINITY_DN704_c0_g1_i18.p1  ORF type:complete len:200 (-),score=30.91 TRINITY_DN704_c0_g1_i18:118-717(-)